MLLAIEVMLLDAEVMLLAIEVMLLHTERRRKLSITGTGTITGVKKISTSLDVLIWCKDSIRLKHYSMFLLISSIFETVSSLMSL